MTRLRKAYFLVKGNFMKLRHTVCSYLNDFARLWRKSWFSRTGAQRTFKYVSTGSAKKRDLQTSIVGIKFGRSMCATFA
jgi:hypothetical protein